MNIRHAEPAAQRAAAGRRAALWFPTSMILTLVLVVGNSCTKHDERLTGESVRIENDLKAPLQLALLRAWVRPGLSEEWVETCFQYSVRNNTKESMDSYSYDVGPNGAEAYAMGKSFVVPKPLQSLIAEQCVANNVYRDEGQFLFRLSFVERNGKALWESEEYERKRQEIDRLTR